MANISITSANVLPIAGSSVLNAKVAGETIVAGEWLYVGTDRKLYKASTFTLESANVVGLSANAGYEDQPVAYISKSTSCAIGSVVTTGHLYFLSSTAGKMYTAADMVAGSNDYPMFIAQAVTDSTISFDFTDPAYPSFRT